MVEYDVIGVLDSLFGRGTVADRVPPVRPGRRYLREREEHGPTVGTELSLDPTGKRLLTGNFVVRPSSMW